ncbi:JAB domain-containing protein [Pedobacter africanus]|nr:JAB domain-containing protein [Pedobacter africanus]
MYQAVEFTTSYLNEPKHNYYSRRPAVRRYITGNSYNTYQMAKEAIPERQGYWLMLFDGTGALAHTEKLGDQTSGFGEIGTILHTALRQECLSIVLVSCANDYYQANRKDLVYNINLIAAACGISMVLLDHIVMEPDGYYSYRDNGLLSYMEN